MNLTAKQLRQIIKEELESVLETQKSIAGLGQTYSPEALVTQVENFIKYNDLSNVRSNPELKEKADFLLKMVSNAVRDVVKHRADPVYDDDYNIIAPATTPEETKVMKDQQKELKRARNLLARAMGYKHMYRRDSSRSDAMRDADPTGAKQRAGMQPRDISKKYADTLSDPQFDMQQIRRMRKK
tara:strand:- start:547 stop:1098 length:552 start_codon:yes stop_codon:yes gene_type:complete